MNPETSAAKLVILLAAATVLCLETAAGGSASESHACPITAEWSSTDQDQLAADRASIDQLMMRWSAAVEAADLETIVSLVTEDAEFWTHGAAALVGREALADAFGPFLQKYAMRQAFECEELVISGELAFMRGTEVNRLTPAEGGETIVRRQRAFSVLRRTADGSWRFARGMTNLPPESRQ